MSVVNSWATSVRGAELDFLPTVVYAIEQLDAGNTTELAKLLTVAHGKSSKLIKVVDNTRTKYAAPIKKIVDAVCEGRVTYKFDEKKACGVAIKVNVPEGQNSHQASNPDYLDGLRILGRITVRNEAYKRFIDQFKPETEEKPYDAKAWAERAIKAQGKEHLEAMIAALQALR